jgi:hypothetical protein
MSEADPPLYDVNDFGRPLAPGSIVSVQQYIVSRGFAFAHIDRIRSSNCVSAISNRALRLYSRILGYKPFKRRDDDPYLWRFPQDEQFLSVAAYAYEHRLKRKETEKLCDRLAEYLNSVDWAPA